MKSAFYVALFTRAWIEILSLLYCAFVKTVALFTRAWIEITPPLSVARSSQVALFTRAWIEIAISSADEKASVSRPLYEGVD